MSDPSKPLHPTQLPKLPKCDPKKDLIRLPPAADHPVMEPNPALVFRSGSGAACSKPPRAASEDDEEYDAARPRPSSQPSATVSGTSLPYARAPASVSPASPATKGPPGRRPAPGRSAGRGAGPYGVRGASGGEKGSTGSPAAKPRSGSPAVRQRSSSPY